jgi:hypothetical protein
METREQIVEIQKQLDRLTKLVERVASAQKQEAKWRMAFRRQVNALVRRAFLSDAGLPHALPHPMAIGAQRFKLRSQHEEDGITLALLRAAGVKHRTFVEIGCGSNGGNSGILAYELGWSGLMVDANRKAADGARLLFQFNPGVQVVKSRLESRTIDEFLTRHGVAPEVDFMSIDIDSFDYWLWEAITVCSPRVLVMEYNGLLGRERAVTVPDGPRPPVAPKGYGGASLAALEKLGRRKGYGLVLCEDAGINAFFLRNDVAPEVPRLTAAQAFRAQLTSYDAASDVEKDVDLYAAITRAGLPLVDV